MSVLDKFLDAIRLNDDYEEEDADSDSFFDEEDDDIEEKPDVIELDPPRDGIHPKALPKILDYGVDTIVYISCKVTSLARDLAMFQARGYEVVKAVAVDQFCETVHVETVCLLSRKAQ